MKEFFSNFKNSMVAKCFMLMLSMFVVNSASAQTRVQGEVADESGTPLPGVTVVVVGTNIGTTTDIRGNYSIFLKKEGELEFSFLGLKSKRKQVSNKTSRVDVVLESDVALIDDIVVVGYGTQRRGDITNAVSQIKGAALLKAPVSNITQGLAGRLPGLTSLQASGQPGADGASLSIRRNGAGLAYIVDGIRQDNINDIDVNDVETVSILKDGAAAAVYGLNGSGGVMIINTKKGKAGDSKITYRGSYGASINTGYPEFLDAPGYAYYYNKAMELDGRDPAFTKAQVDMMLNNDPTDGWGNTNWMDEIFGVGTIQQHSVTSTGGSEKINYFASLGYMGQTGNIKNFNYDRYNFRSNIDAKIARDFTFTLGVSGTLSDQKQPGFDAGGSMAAGVSQPAWLSIAEQAAYAHPYLPMEYNGMSTGSVNAYGNVINPIAALEDSGDKKTQGARAQLNAALNWKIPWVKGLSAKAMGAYSRSSTTSKSLITPYYLMRATIPNSTTNHIQYNESVDPRGKTTVDLTESYSQSTLITSQLNLNYDNKFNEVHGVKAILLMETQDRKSNDFWASGKDIPFPELPELDHAVSPNTKSIGGKSGASRRVGFVFRANYDYDSRYLFEVSGRYDGSYKFFGNVSGKRWGFFPSVSAGWVLSNEKFFQNCKNTVDNLKVRASFGSVGSDSNSGEYAYLSTFGNVSKFPSAVIGGYPNNGIMTSLTANELLTWQRTETYNIGFDATLWGGKLGFVFDAFYNYTFDILGANGGKPGSMGGYFPTYINNNSYDVRGIDVAISHSNTIGDFSYRAVVNLTWAQDRILKVQDSPNIPEYARRTGKSNHVQMGYVADGLFQNEAEIDNSPLIDGQARPRVGDIKYQDLNGDGRITYSQDRAYIGRGQLPQFNGSLNLYGAWKGIDIDLLFIGAASCDVSLTGTYYNWAEDHTIFTRPFKAGSNAPRFLAEGSWTPDNPDAEYPRLSINNPTSNNAYASSFWYRDGKYLRLKSASIGYTLPKRLLSKARIQNLRIYVEGSNLFTLSGLPEGMDPERPGVTNGYYPQQRTVVGGVELTF